MIEYIRKQEIAEIEKVLKRSCRYRTGRRNRALILASYHAGLRCSELVGHEKRDGGGLRLRDVDLTTGKLTVRDAKGGESRRVWISGEALESMRRWFDDRLQIGSADPDSLVFTTLDGGQLSNRYVRDAFARIATKAGLPPEVRHLHALRHAAAMRLLQGGTSLSVIQQVLGHKNLQTTAHYLHDDEAAVCLALGGTNEN